MKSSKSTFGGGCFWCTETVFKSLKGVLSVTSGYEGGDEPDPDYHDLHRDAKGYAEVVEIEFDSDMISFETLVEVHLTTHDPTTLNQQGADKGPLYRSVIFFHDTEQESRAKKVIKRLADVYPDPIVTELSPSKKFYAAEDSHQNFFETNSDSFYCQAVILPKLVKLRQKHRALLK